MFANPNQSMTFMTCDDKESVISKHDSFKNSSLLSRRKSNQSNLQTVLGVSCECSIGYRPGMFRLTTNGMDKQRSCQAKPCQIMSNHAKSCQIMPNHALHVHPPTFPCISSSSIRSPPTRARWAPRRRRRPHKPRQIHRTWNWWRHRRHLTKTTRTWRWRWHRWHTQHRHRWCRRW